MKWCIIGAGWIADRRTIPAILKDKANQLVAVMDRVATVAKKIGEKYGVPYFTEEKEAIIVDRIKKDIKWNMKFILIDTTVHKVQMNQIWNMV